MLRHWLIELSGQRAASQIHLVLVSPNSAVQNCPFCPNILTLLTNIEFERLGLSRTALRYRVALESSAHLNTSEPSTVQIACKFRGKLITDAMNEPVFEDEEFPAHMGSARAAERNEIKSMMDRLANSKSRSLHFLVRKILGRGGRRSYPSLSLRSYGE